MKKILMLQFFAVIALVSQAWGEYAPCTAALGNTYYCQWPSGCYEINKGKTDTENCQTNYDGCKKDGYLYINVTVTGDDKKCNGVWAGEGFDPSFNEGVPIWCQWTTGCQPIKHDSTLTNCKTNGSVYKNVNSADVGDDKSCKNSGEWTGEGKNPNPPSSSSTATTTSSSSDAGTPSSSGTGTSSSSVADGTSSSAGISSSTGTSSPSGTSSSSDTGTSSSSDNTPIISYNRTPVVGLNVVNFARNLRIASDKNATISLFDINGKQVLNQKVLKGTTTISLGKQKVGVYYVVAKSDSQKQIVKIVLK